jgi:hypothetical protein
LGSGTLLTEAAERNSGDYLGHDSSGQASDSVRGERLLIGGRVKISDSEPLGNHESFSPAVARE